MTYLITSLQYQSGSVTVIATLPLLFNYQLKYNKAKRLFKFENEFGFLQANADQQQLRPVQAIAQILSDLNKQKSVKNLILNLS